MQSLFKNKKAQAGAAVGSIITLIVGVGIAVLVMIFVGSLGGQTWELVEDDVTAITNETIENHVRSSVISGFSALETTGDYLPIVVLAVIIALVLGLVLSFGGIGGGFRGGSAL